MQELRQQPDQAPGQLREVLGRALRGAECLLGFPHKPPQLNAWSFACLPAYLWGWDTALAFGGHVTTGTWVKADLGRCLAFFMKSIIILPSEASKRNSTTQTHFPAQSQLGKTTCASNSASCRPGMVLSAHKGHFSSTLDNPGLDAARPHSQARDGLQRLSDGPGTGGRESSGCWRWGAVQECSQDSAPPELEAQRTSLPVTQTQAFPPKLVFLLTLNCKKVWGGLEGERGGVQNQAVQQTSRTTRLSLRMEIQIS